MEQQQPLKQYHTLTRNPSRRFTRNYIQHRTNARNVDGHHIFLLNNINQINKVQASRTNVETNQRQQFYSELGRIEIEEGMKSKAMVECSVCLVELSVGSKEIRLSCSHV
ncbi:uncharacterized protein LOC123895955 [Trifolium pratense]|uniref:uncharacterized protein LOC123895955 n=1 Tax=Trifolium pratense TaxID=57577 RepID=UPI001E69514A|nr:uncharacterized protein LOC123895955 [Trifolium pratense]